MALETFWKRRSCAGTILAQSLDLEYHNIDPAAGFSLVSRAARGSAKEQSR